MLGIGAMNAFHLKMKMENKNAGIGLRCRNFSLVKHRLSFYNDRLCRILCNIIFAVYCFN